MNAIEVHGTVAAGFESVRAEFAAVVAEESGESGAQLAAFVRGRQVVDLWAGRDVSPTTVTGLHSSSKGAAGLVIALLIQDGVLDVDRPVAHYWPRFGAAGKERITVRDVLVHRCGVIGVDGGFTVAESRRLRVQRPRERAPGRRPAPRRGRHRGHSCRLTLHQPCTSRPFSVSPRPVRSPRSAPPATRAWLPQGTSTDACEGEKQQMLTRPSVPSDRNGRTVRSIL